MRSHFASRSAADGGTRPALQTYNEKVFSITLAQRIELDLARLRTWFDEKRAERNSTQNEAAAAVPDPARPGLAASKWGGAALALIVVIVLVFFDCNMLRRPLSRYASSRLHRQVRIEGNLHVYLWSWTPRVDIGGLHIANTKWAGGGDMVDVGHLTFTVRLLRLYPKANLWWRSAP